AVSQIGGATARSASRGTSPAWMARVANPCSSCSSRSSSTREAYPTAPPAREDGDVRSDPSDRTDSARASVQTRPFRLGGAIAVVVLVGLLTVGLATRGGSP